MKKRAIIITSMMILCAVFLFLGFSIRAEGLKNYYCVKCGNHIEAVNQPSLGNCPEGGGHHWRCLGEVGDKNYQCSKCGLTIRSKDMPYGCPCKMGGGHNWKRIS